MKESLQTDKKEKSKTAYSAHAKDREPNSHGRYKQPNNSNKPNSLSKSSSSNKPNSPSKPNSSNMPNSDSRESFINKDGFFNKNSSFRKGSKAEKIAALALSASLLLNMVLFAVGKISITVFWLNIAVAAAFVYLLLPKIRKLQNNSL